ncbi:MAG TPA: aldo/keto reductase [Burkholderiaceae bacterium]|nr:aldo/keto reductase [Burkholderiaceae bacterium]
MNKRTLGRSGIEVAPLCFGGNVFGWTADEPTSFSLLDAFVDAGFDFIDTADRYSAWVAGHRGGESETIIGKWLARSGRRRQVVIATKVGLEMPGVGKGLKREYILQAADASLRRLQTDYIDLYQSHTDDADTPLQESLEAYDRLIRQGKVRAIGASNYDAARLMQALAVSREHGLPRYETLQPLYNLYDRETFEKELEAACIDNGIGVINWYSLAAGFLTGKYREPSDAGKSVRGRKTVETYLNDRGRRILAALDAVSTRMGATPAQVSIAWLLARPSVTAPIASATDLDQLKQLTAAVRLRLDAEALETLNRASAW